MLHGMFCPVPHKSWLIWCSLLKGFFFNPYGENEWKYSGKYLYSIAVFCDNFKTHQLCFVVLFWSKVILLSKRISQRASRLIYSLHNCFHDHFQLSLSLTLDVWCGPAVLLMNIKHSIFINFIMLCVSANPSTTPPLSNRQTLSENKDRCFVWKDASAVLHNWSHPLALY